MSPNRGSCCVRGGLTNILDYIRELYSSISPQGRSVSDGLRLLVATTIGVFG